MERHRGKKEVPEQCKRLSGLPEPTQRRMKPTGGFSCYQEGTHSRLSHTAFLHFLLLTLTWLLLAPRMFREVVLSLQPSPSQLGQPGQTVSVS